MYIGKEKKLLTIIFIFAFMDSATTLSGPYLIGISIDAMASGSVNFKLLEIRFDHINRFLYSQWHSPIFTGLAYGWRIAKNRDESQAYFI